LQKLVRDRKSLAQGPAYAATPNNSAITAFCKEDSIVFGLSELTLADHVHDFVTLQGALRCVE
jgi:hypothetical protein